MTTLAHHFTDAHQQRQAALLGMWTFLATEILFFGGLMLSYAVYRYRFHPAWFFGSSQLNMTLGGLNTAVLLTSSLTAALAVHFAHAGRRRAVLTLLALTALLGVAFLVIKGFEDSAEYREHLIPAIDFHPTNIPATVTPGNVALFMIFYFLMTLVHAAHMLIGLGLLTFLMLTSSRRRRPIPANRIEIAILYWHFVDLVWIFLFPLLYLVRR